MQCPDHGNFILVQKEGSKPRMLAHAYNPSTYEASLGYVLRPGFVCFLIKGRGCYAEAKFHKQGSS